MTPKGACPRLVRFKKGESLWRQGDSPQEVLALRSGLLKMQRLGRGGSALIAGLGLPGQIIGASECILGLSRLSACLAVREGSAECIPRQDFLQALRRDREYSFAVHEALSRECRRQTAWMHSLACLPAPQRLLSLLREILRACCAVEEGGISGTMHLPFTHQEIAEASGMTPEHLSRLLRSVRPSLPFRRERGRVKVLDRQAFQAWAGEGPE